MKYRRTGAYWFLRELWDHYCPHYARPEYSTAGFFLIGLSVVPEERLLPGLRRLWARHLRTFRNARLAREEAELVRYRNNCGGGDPAWIHYLWSRLCRVRKMLSKAQPPLTTEEVLAAVAHRGTTQCP